MKTPERIYAALLRLYPREFRELHRDEMLELFRWRYARAPRRRLWLSLVWDTVRNAALLHVQETKRHPYSTRPRSREMHLMTDVRYAFRSFLRRPGFAVTAVMTLALGIGATTAIFSVANAVLLRELPYPDSDELALVWADDRTNPSPTADGQMSSPDFRDIQTASSAIESMALYTNTNLTLSGDGPAEVVPGGRVTRELFHVFGAEPLLGRSFTAEEERYQGPDAVVVSEAFWRTRLGGDQAVFGSTIMISGRPHPVVGVAPKGFDFPAGAQLWVPAQNDEEGCGRGCFLMASVARLRDGVTLERAQMELAQLSAGIEADHAETSTNLIYRATPLRDVIVGDVKSALWIMLAAVGMVLLIACANVANLILLRGGSRRTELAVRTALGAGRRRLLSQLMTENATLALLGGAGGLVLAWWSIAGLVRLAPEQLPRIEEVGIDGATALFALGIVALTTVIFGLAPALRISREGIAEAIRRGSRGAVGERGGNRARSLVLVAEVALSVMLLLAAGLMLRSLARMQTVDLGVSTDDVAVFRLSLPSARYDGPDARIAFLDRLDQRLEALPGVQAVASGAAVPFGTVNLNGSFSRPDLPAPDPGEGPEATYRTLDADALEVLGLEVVRGRFFDERDRQGAQPVAIINEAAAEQYWPGEDPIGRQMDVNISVGYEESAPRVVVGIIRNFRDEVTTAPGPEMYVPTAQSAPSFPHVAIRSAGRSASDVLGEARQVLAELDPELPLVQPASMDAMVGEQLAAPRFYLLLLSLFAVLAVALAAVGIYGVVAFMVVQRTREIGVRVALGAPTKDVVRLVVWQGIGPALAGLTLGLAGAFALGRLLSGILYEVAPTDAMTWAFASLLLLGVVAAATALPARRATMIPPTRALQSD